MTEHIIPQVSHNSALTGDYEGMRIFLAHLVVSMGGSVVLQPEEVRTMLEADYEIQYYQDDVGRAIIKARRTSD